MPSQASLPSSGTRWTRAFAELKSENAKMKMRFAEVKAELKLKLLGSTFSSG